MPLTSIDESLYKQFSVFLEQQCGIVLGDNKQYLVRSRLVPVAHEFQFGNLDEFIKAAINSSNTDLRQAVVNAMTTNETSWFRDNYPFNLLKNEIFPENAQKNLKIWCAACSSGQEPYSVAMTHLEFKQQHPRASGKVSIIGTDICDTVLAAAKEGEYSELSMARGLSVERMATFFSRLGGSHYRINNEVKSLVNFQSINLLQSYAHLGKFDIVFCRNVLIYFSPAVKKKILQQIASLLPPDGILFVGASESISSMTDLFVMQRSTHEIYYKKKD